MTELINLHTNTLGSCLVLLTNSETSDIIDSVMHIHELSGTCGMERLHYSACTLHMHIFFSMFKTTHMNNE